MEISATRPALRQSLATWTTRTLAKEANLHQGSTELDAIVAAVFSQNQTSRRKYFNSRSVQELPHFCNVMLPQDLANSDRRLQMVKGRILNKPEFLFHHILPASPKPNRPIKPFASLDLLEICQQSLEAPLSIMSN